MKNFKQKRVVYILYIVIILVIVTAFLSRRTFRGWRWLNQNNRNLNSPIILNNENKEIINEAAEVKDKELLNEIVNDVKDKNLNSAPTEEVIEKKVEDEIIKPQVIPNFLDYPVPFAPQAPFAVWDDLHNEACEEAAMIIADSFFKDYDLNAHIMEQGILKLVRWEQENGYTIDVTAKEVKEILEQYFGLKAELILEVNVEKIQRELNNKKLIIVPAAGRLLKNPFYKRPGPLYHMLVIRGYDSENKEFITNDPGTKRGEGYRYKYNIFLNAIHDWPKLGKTKDDVSEAEMNAGQKIIIAVSE